MDRKVDYLKAKNSQQGEQNSLNVPVKPLAPNEAHELDDRDLRLFSEDLGEKNITKDVSTSNHSISIPKKKESSKNQEVKSITQKTSSLDIPIQRRTKPTNPIATPTKIKDPHPHASVASIPVRSANREKTTEVSSLTVHSVPAETELSNSSNYDFKQAFETLQQLHTNNASEKIESTDSSTVETSSSVKPTPKKIATKTTVSTTKQIAKPVQPLSIETKETAKKTSYDERRAVGIKFYQNLLKVFLVTCLICGSGLGYLWFWLTRYESQSMNGAIRNYLTSIQQQDWDSIYEEDVTYFIELNSKEKYIHYLRETYGDLDISSLTYAFSNTDGYSEFYFVYDKYNNLIGSLELKKPEGSKTWKVRTLNANISYSFDILNQVPFTLNGVNINGTPNETATVPYGFRDLGLDDELPSVVRYTLSNFVDSPDIQLSDSTATSIRDWTGNQYYVGPTATDEQYREFSEQIQETAIAYCKYITKDGTFYELTRHLYPNTDFYINISGFNNQWFSSHDSIEFQNTRVYDVMPIGDNAFIGSISFDYIVLASDVQKTYSSAYQLFFIKDANGQWKMTNLSIISSSQDESNT